MSLKAKLEAVIYAAEEPVTLAQLAVLFATDALEWKSEQEPATADALTEMQEAAEIQSTMVEEFVYAEAGEDQGLSENAPAPEPESAIAAEPSAETVSSSDGAPEPAADQQNPPSDEASVDAELEALRLARQRDREARVVIQQLIDELIDDYVSDDRGIEIRQIAGGYRMATKPECHDAVRSFVKSLKPALKLSLPALETLAVVAYKQPVTAPEVNEIRGVDSSGVFGSLLARKLITTAGRKQVIGRPILYKTTREFLLRFGLKDVSELPSMEEFEKMAAIELDEPELAPDGKSDPLATADLDLNLELDESDDQPGDEFGEDFSDVTTETP
ncbi:MAG: SMC-Scp complex subunit ScpB [Terracidiphilus sp.]